MANFASYSSSKQMSTPRNPYELLIDNNNEPKETDSIQRKARKKLREIEHLKKKKIKTLDEELKIKQESEWKMIATPVDASPSETDEERFLRKEKQFERKKQEYERKLKAKEKQIHSLYKQNQFKDEEIQLQERKIQEQNKQFQALLNEFQKISLSQTSCSDSIIETIIKKEFDDNCKSCPQQSRDTIWRKLMNKYHPDKISKHIGSEIANELGKIAIKFKPLSS